MSKVRVQVSSKNHVLLIPSNEAYFNFTNNYNLYKNSGFYKEMLEIIFNINFITFYIR